MCCFNFRQFDAIIRALIFKQFGGYGVIYFTQWCVYHTYVY
ncbi:hypothetical protein P20311_3083 [Pseudoalteromonas sp. BSi20311]|nr:hypothetical protein P20311_3083 [Pseudoalteromonas sp. BSi20311]GAA72061.1 hypothetical protein P20439_2145 [Pseudoalteromonas sp. BSi20439]